MKCLGQAKTYPHTLLSNILKTEHIQPLSILIIMTNECETCKTTRLVQNIQIKKTIDRSVLGITHKCKKKLILIRKQIKS